VLHVLVGRHASLLVNGELSHLLTEDIHYWRKGNTAALEQRLYTDQSDTTAWNTVSIIVLYRRQLT